MANYFNTLNLRQQLAQLGKCRFMQRAEFVDGCNVLKGKKVVIVGCGAQGLNQGLGTLCVTLTCFAISLIAISAGTIRARGCFYAQWLDTSASKRKCRPQSKNPAQWPGWVLLFLSSER